MWELELLQEANVVLDQVADIGDAVKNHGETIQAHSEGKARDGIGIKEGVAAFF